MRVLFVPDIYETGGAFKSFCELVHCLSTYHEVEPIILCSKEGKYSEFARKNGYHFYIVRYYGFYVWKETICLRRIAKYLLIPIYFLRYKIFDMFAIRKIEKNINLKNIQLIHTNVNRNDIGAIIAKKYKIPHIWHIREFTSKEKFYSLLYNHIEFMNKHTNCFITISKAVKYNWIGRGIDKNKVKVIYNGVDHLKYRYMHNNKKHSEKIRIVMLGELTEQKGQIDLLRALSLMTKDELNNFSVDFYGRGVKEYIAFLKNFVQKEQLENYVRFCGNIDFPETILYQYDIGMMCSTNEGFGRVTVEYMMSGLCVVASDSGANPEIVVEGKNGYLYPDENYNALKICLLKCVDNREELEKIKRNAVIFAKEKFSAITNADKIYKVYTEMYK